MSPADPARALAALVKALGREPRRWYLFGAQAAAVHGRPRLTADIDITVEADPEDTEHLLEILAAEDVVLRIAYDAAFVRRSRVLPLLHRPSGVPVDLVLAGPGIEEEFLSDAREVTIAGVQVRVISPEDLVVTKILAGRPKDLDDVVSVLREQGSRLDLERCRHFLKMLEEALGQSDLRPALDKALAQAAVPG